MPKYTVEEMIEGLAGAGLLTERQAEAYVYREIELVPRQEAADEMGISPSTLDDYVSDAKEKIRHAEVTVKTLERYCNQLPDQD